MSRWLLVLLAGTLAVTGCRQKMASLGRLKPFEATDAFADGASARQPVPGTIARGQWPTGSVLVGGVAGGHEWPAFPTPVTAAMLARGRQRYTIACIPCHGATGAGDGIVVQRGFPAPPAFGSPRLLRMPPGHVVRVIAAGYGAMYPYAEHVAPADRWAIAAYIRALQLSGRATRRTVPAGDRP